MGRNSRSHRRRLMRVSARENVRLWAVGVHAWRFGLGWCCWRYWSADWMCKCRRHVRICIKCSHVRANIALLHTILVCEFEKECTHTHTHTHTRHRIHQTSAPLSLSLYLCMCVHIRARIMLCVADISSYKAVVTVVYERTNSFNVFVCRFVRGRTEWLRLHGTSNHLINAVR